MAGVYISYPFCNQKCTYCNFASGVFAPALRARYRDALLREIKAAKPAWVPETVYLGGGTPSTMDPAELDTVLEAVPGRPWREATLECAPATVTSERVRRWLHAGINRVSLGVQSFVRSELARTGRTHTADIVAADVNSLRANGISNINLDLIAGLPGQNERSWEESLGWIERLSPPHVSVYMLEVDEDSRLGREILLKGSRYGAADAPDEDVTAALYERAVERLRGMGISRYEISNFAQPGFESTHNMKYWRREAYIGFGADAHSFSNGLRWQNVESVETYVERSPDVRTSETPAIEDEEKFFIGLRLEEGIEPTESDRQRHGETILRFVRGGMMEEAGTRLRLTARGIMVSNEIFQEFLSA